MKTVKQLTDEIRAQMWPSGEAENLKISPVTGVRSAHDGHFQEGLAEIAKWSPCEQEEVVNVTDFCQTTFRCGMTIVPAPRGTIRRVFTVVGDDFCDPVEYRAVRWPMPEWLGRGVLANVGTLPTVADLPLGFSKADAATDCTIGRARTGVWSLWRGNIYIFPWIQSTEKVVVEWDGIKSEWGDSDVVNEDQDYKQSLKLYAQYAHERDFGATDEAAKFKGLFDQALGDLIWACHQRRKLPSETSSSSCLPCARLLCGTFEESGIATAASLVLANIGAFGGGGANEAAVAQMVKSFAPEVIIADAPKPITNDYDLNVGQFYQQYIKPYAGAYGEGSSDKNRFWPAPGNTDLDNLAQYEAFFSELPNNQRYYDVCLGLVHLFMVSSGDGEADILVDDAKDPDSIEGIWLKTKLMLSTARWKIVVMDNGPYITTNPDTALRWDYKAWGADLVISAFPRYERRVVDGLNYVNNGSGGKALSTTVDAPAGVAFDQTHFGAGKLTVTEGSLQYDFIDVGGVVRDTFTLTKT